MDDLNLVVLSGRLAAEPDKRTFASGSRLLRMLVAVRSKQPRRRVDVLPVSLWDPPARIWNREMEPGDRVWAAGSVQRRFWASEVGRRSRLELIAAQVQVREGDTRAAQAGDIDSADDG